MKALQESITFQRRASANPDSPDDYGNTRSDFATYYGPVSARIQPINGREEVIAQRLQGVQPLEITIRYSALATSLRASDRAINARTGEVYDIIDHRNPDEKRRYISLLVVRGVGNGA